MAYTPEYTMYTQARQFNQYSAETQKAETMVRRERVTSQYAWCRSGHGSIIIDGYCDTCSREWLK